MESAVKADVNGGVPLPQRQPKNAQTGGKIFNKSSSNDGPSEKKPRFNQSVNHGDGGGGGSNNQGGNQSKGFIGNKGFGNRNRNRGGSNQSKVGNFHNQNQVSCLLHTCSSLG